LTSPLVGDTIQTNVHYEQVVAMSRVLYLKFIGARARQEAKDRCLTGSKPLVLLDGELVIDCDKDAWDDGVRPGDTLRQARISSPVCEVVRVSGAGGERLTAILDVLAKFSPYVEPVADQSGVFVDISPATSLREILSALNGMYFKAFAAVSSSKLISRAACDLFMEDCLDGVKVPSGKAKWGSLRQENDLVVASIDSGKEKAFISGAPIDSLWMVPPEVLSMLRSLGLKKVKDLQEVSVSHLAERIGDWATMVKRWAAGVEHSKVQALYPPPSLTKEVDFLEFVPLQKDLFLDALKELSASLVEKGVGFKSISLSISGDFKPLSGNLSGERKFVRPVCSLEAMKAAVNAILDGFLEEIRHRSQAGPAPSVPVLSGFRLRLDDITPVQAKPSPLFAAGVAPEPKVIPVALGLALFGLEDKFGDGAVTWGKSENLSEFKPEIMRREKMLSFWDPMRPQVFEEIAAAAVGGVADV
jgi:hypothetical protein